MSEILPPPRGLLYARPVPVEEGGGFEIGCDCGTVTQLIVEGPESVTEIREMAFTCDGCQSAHWFTLTPPEQREGAP